MTFAKLDREEFAKTDLEAARELLEASESIFAELRSGLIGVALRACMLQKCC